MHQLPAMWSVVEQQSGGSMEMHADGTEAQAVEVHGGLRNSGLDATGGDAPC